EQMSPATNGPWSGLRYLGATSDSRPTTHESNAATPVDMPLSTTATMGVSPLTPFRVSRVGSGFALNICGRKVRIVGIPAIDLTPTTLESASMSCSERHSALKTKLVAE